MADREKEKERKQRYENKYKQVCIRLSTDGYNTIKKQADEENKTVTNLLKDLIREYFGVDE